VDYIVNQITEKILEKIAKKDKNLAVKPFQVKAHLWVFITALIINPTFDSQTK
jgi:DNA topoisomerase-2